MKPDKTWKEAQKQITNNKTPVRSSMDSQCSAQLAAHIASHDFRLTKFPILPFVFQLQTCMDKNGRTRMLCVSWIDISSKISTTKKVHSYSDHVCLLFTSTHINGQLRRQIACILLRTSCSLSKGRCACTTVYVRSGSCPWINDAGFSATYEAM